MINRVRWLLAVFAVALALMAALLTLGQPAQADPAAAGVVSAFAYGLATDGLYPKPHWTLDGTQLEQRLGFVVAPAGDVNGDGYEDVLVGAHGTDVVSGTAVLENAGRAMLFFGSPTGVSETPDWVVEGGYPNAYVGIGVGTAGNVNGDEYDDIVIGEQGYDVVGPPAIENAGRASVYYGSGTGPSTTPDWTAVGDQANGSFGRTVGSAGNVNGDDYDDLFVASHVYDNPEQDEGMVWVFHGSATGPSTTANWTAESDHASSYFGWRAEGVGTAGDVNGDGYDDFIVGAAHWDTGPGLQHEGGIFVWHGSSSGLGDPGTPANASWTARSKNWGYAFGFAAGAAGDVNGDGYDDVIAGSHLYNVGGPLGKGAAFAWYGSAAPTGLGPNGDLTNADWTRVGEQQEYGAFGYTMSAAGDVNGDGYDDVLVSARLYDAGQIDEGRGYLFLGDEGDLGTDIAWTAEGNQQEAWFGWALAPAGDVNGDGFDDTLVGAYLHGTSDEGRAYLFHGWACRAQIDGQPTVYDTVQAAVDAATESDLIKVSGYCPGTSTRGGLTQGVYVTKTVTIEGGYLPDFEDAPDPESYPTAIDALGGGRGMVISGTISPLVEGLRIAGGDALGQGGIGEFGDRDGGGGVYIFASTATISNCAVYSNTAEGGAGLAASFSNATIRGNDIYSNTATDQSGGGVLVGGTGTATIRDNRIHDNVSTGGTGGGVACFYASPALSGNEISDNYTDEHGGGVSLQECNGAAIEGNTIVHNESDVDGGGIYVEDSQASLTGNVIVDNTSDTGSAGGVKLQTSHGATLSANEIMSNTANWVGAGVFLNDSDATVAGNTISANTGNEGSGITLTNSDATLTGNTISGNTANWRSGGLTLENSDAVLRDNIVSGNQAPSEGGAGRIQHGAPTFTNNVVLNNTLTSGGGTGSGLFIADSQPTLLHTTVSNNTGGDGTGIYLDGANNVVTMTNSIVANQVIGIEADSGSVATIDGVLWYANSDNTDGAGTFNRTNQYPGDPAFTSDGYHLSVGSAAFDRGVDAAVMTDIDGDARPAPAGTNPDLGADEVSQRRAYLPLVIRNQ
jgi:putative cofactor-binding repeat protein